MSSTVSWEAWRRRLAELRGAIEAHLDVADALAARAAAASDEDAPDAPQTAPASEGEAAPSPPPQRVTQPAPADPPPEKLTRSPEVQRALDHLASHYMRPVGLAELARAAGCGRDRLARLVREETGLTLQAHLRQLRLAHAAREVRAGDKIEAVMLGVGYRGKRNFYRQFKARFGTTPGRWRESGRDRS